MITVVGIPQGWPIFDHEAMGNPQASNFSMVSGPPQTSRIKTLGGPSRSRTRRQRAGLIVSLDWLMTSAQVQLLRTFWDDELGNGGYPFALYLMLNNSFEWRACRFLREFSQQSLSASDWKITSEVYVGYQPTWALKPGAVGMPYQTPTGFNDSPNPIGFLVPEPVVDIEIESFPTFSNLINPFLISELGPSVGLSSQIQAPFIGLI